MARFIIWLIRKRLGVGLHENFRFTNQKKDAIYWFTATRLMKIENGKSMPSNVSLNWMIDPECKIRKA